MMKDGRIGVARQRDGEARRPKGTIMTPGTYCEPMTPDAEGWSEWIHPLPGYLMQCCDCDLIHEMEFAIVEQVGEGPLNEGEGVASVVVFRARRHGGTA